MGLSCFRHHADDPPWFLIRKTTSGLEAIYETACNPHPVGIHCCLREPNRTAAQKGRYGVRLSRPQGRLVRPCIFVV